MRVILGCFAVWLLYAAPIGFIAVAEQSAPAFKGERKLMKVPPTTDAAINLMRCGEYFLSYSEIQPDGKRWEMISYFFDPDKQEKGLVQLVGLTRKDDLEPPVIDPDKTVPTVEIKKSGKMETLILRIAWKDYEKSSCLPAPKIK